MRILACFAIAWATSALAQTPAPQSPAALQSVVRDFLAQQTREQPGEVSIKVNEPDPRLKLPPCAQIEAFLPNGARLAGRTLVGVRCKEGNVWQTFVAAEVHIRAPVWVPSRPLSAGSQLTMADLRSEMR